MLWSSALREPTLLQWLSLGYAKRGIGALQAQSSVGLKGQNVPLRWRSYWIVNLPLGLGRQRERMPVTCRVMRHVRR